MLYQQLNHVYLQHCIPGRSSGHSILVVRLVLVYLYYPASLVLLGYLADQGGPWRLAVLHLAGLWTEEMGKKTKSFINKQLLNSVTTGELGQRKKNEGK